MLKSKEGYKITVAIMQIRWEKLKKKLIVSEMYFFNSVEYWVNFVVAFSCFLSSDYSPNVSSFKIPSKLTFHWFFSAGVFMFH